MSELVDTHEPDADRLEAQIASPLAAIAGELKAIRQALAPTSGRPFAIPNGAVVDANGNGFVFYDGPRVGKLWRVELVSVSVAAAAAAASVELYAGMDTTEINIVGFLAALGGNSPSRGFLSPAAPVLLFDATPLIVAVRGAPVGAQVTCRIQGIQEDIGE